MTRHFEVHFAASPSVLVIAVREGCAVSVPGREGLLCFSGTEVFSRWKYGSFTGALRGGDPVMLAP